MATVPYKNIYLFEMTVICICLPIHVFAASLCPNFTYSIQNASTSVGRDTKINIANYTCPGLTNPNLNTECCTKAGISGCCPPEKRYFYEIDTKYATILAITVVLCWAILTVVIIVCCFWSECPLYTSCRVECSPEIATYESKEDNISMDTMPVELSSKGSKFSPVIISNGNLDADNNPL